MISTSEIKVSVLIDEQDADRAVLAVHESFSVKRAGAFAFSVPAHMLCDLQ
jgi:hypothetical protein